MKENEISLKQAAWLVVGVLMIGHTPANGVVLLGYIITFYTIYKIAKTLNMFGF